jgi:serine O-acetyltransferase
MKYIDEIKEEIRVIRERDPAMHSDWEVFLYPSFRALMSYRKAHKLYLKGHYFRARRISQKAASRTGIDIHPGAQIGKGFFIDHGIGVVIGETTIIGDNVTLYQGVTLGGTGKEQGKRHPTVGNNVMIGAGAKILGSFTIGDNCKIAAGSVVLEEVPPGCTVVGVPGRIVKQLKPGLHPQDTMDQVHYPDPVHQDIECLFRAETALTDRLIEVENFAREERANARKAEKERDEAKAELEKVRQDIANLRCRELQEKYADKP